MASGDSESDSIIGEFESKLCVLDNNVNGVNKNEDAKIVKQKTNKDVSLKTVEKEESCTPKLGKKKRKGRRKMQLLSHCPIEKIEEALIHKISLCCRNFRDINETSSEIELKEAKLSTLDELTDYISEINEIPLNVYPNIFEMFSKNVFRSLPPRRYSGSESDVEEDDSLLNTTDPSWPELERVYALFLKFIESPNFNVTHSKSLLDQKFTFQLLQVFDSEDPKERDYLKAILHRIYGKFVNLRSYIRKQINYIFLTFIYETEQYSGINELLEFLSSIINGFLLPLRAEHKTFLLKVLLPLHKPWTLPSYHLQLTICVEHFLRKEPDLTEPVVKSLLRFWPRTNSSKELLFLTELKDILSRIRPEELSKVRDPLLYQLLKCIKNPHLEIREKAASILIDKRINWKLDDLEDDKKITIKSALRKARNAQRYQN